MATISNIIQTIFQSSGANNTNRDIDRINRNMTRLGQSSASAGRSFAAQSQGLGGLVAAYAGAAATTFALQQAYDKLAQSARQTQTLEGLNTLAARSGESSSILLENVREITKSQLTLAEAASQINLSLSAGFDSTQIEGLSEVALKASRALGRDLNDAYTRVVRGSAKMETELLDELGIYTKIDPATRAYAAAIGKTVGQLTEFERRQAFVNAVIEEGNRKYSSINTTLPTSAEQIEAFGTRILDISGILGRFLADTLAPLAEFLTTNLTASFAAFGAVASLVAGKGVSVLTTALQTFTAETYKAALATETNIRTYLGIGSATDRAKLAVQNYSRELTGVTNKEKQTFAAIQEVSKARNLSNAELRVTQNILKKNKAAVDAETRAQNDNRRSLLEQNKVARENIRTTERAVVAARQNIQALRQQGASVSQLTAARVALMQAETVANATSVRSNNIISRNRVEMDRLRDSMLGTRSATNALTGAMNSLSAAMGLRGAAAGAGGALLGGFRIGISNIAAGFTGLVSKALGLFSIVSIFTLIGSSIADALGKGREFDFFMRKLAQTAKSFFGDGSSKKMDSVFQGITAGALTELEETDSKLRDLEDFTFDTKFIGIDIELTKTKEDLVREVNSELKGVISGSQGEVGLTSTGSLMGATIGGALGASLLSLIPGIGLLIGPTLGLAIGAAAGSALGIYFQKGFSETKLTFESFGETEAEGKAYVQNLKSEFSEAFAAVGNDLELSLAKAFQNLENDYAGALLDPVARKALEVQRKLLAESAKFSNNIESIAQLTSATGLTADRIKNIFDLTGSVDSFNEYATTVIDFAEEEKVIKFGFIDTFDKDLNALLQSISVEVELDENVISSNIKSALEGISEVEVPAILNTATYSGLQKALNATEVETTTFINNINKAFGGTNAQLQFFVSKINDDTKTLKEALKEVYGIEKLPLLDDFLKANDAINTFTNSTARGIANIVDLQDSLASGDIDLERFDQRVKAISNSIASSSEAYVEAENQLEAFKTELAGLNLASGTEEDKARAAELSNIIESLKTNIILATNGVLISQEQLDLFREQRKELEKQAGVREFLNSITKDAKELDAFKTQMDLVSALAPDDSKLGARLDYLNRFVTASEEQIEAFDRLDEATREAGMSEAARQLILSASVDNIDNLVKSLNELDNVTAFDTFSSTITVQQNKITDVGSRIETIILDLTDANGELVLSTRDALEAQRALIMEAAAELPKVIETTKNELISLINKLTEETNRINTIEIPSLLVEAELDRTKFDFEMDKLRREDAITKLELELDISKLKADLGDITPETDIENQKRIQQEILDERRAILDLERQNQITESIEKLKQLKLENTQNLDIIEKNKQAQIDKVKGDLTSIRNVISAYEAIYSTGKEVNQSNLEDTLKVYRSAADILLKNIVKGANEFSKVAVAALTEKKIITGDSTLIDVATPELSTDKVDFSGVLASLEEYETAAISAIESRAEAEEKAENTRFENARKRELDTIVLEGEAYSQKVQNLKTQAEIEELNHRARLKDLAEERAKGADKAAREREKALKEAQKIVDEFGKKVEKGLKELIDLANSFVKFVFDASIKNKEQQLAADKLGEDLTTSILANTTERLNSVQGELNDALSKETSLKEELVTLSEQLTESQQSYFDAIKEGDLEQASKNYIDTILEQSRKTIELSKVIKDRTLLEGAAQTLEQQKVSAQNAVEQATRERIETEEELAELQKNSAAALELVNSQMLDFNKNIENIGYALYALSNFQMGGASANNPLGRITQTINSFEQAVNTIQRLGGAKGIQGTGTAIAGQAASGMSNAAGDIAGSSAGKLAQNAGSQMANTLVSSAIQGISGAISGAGVGSAVGALLGDDTWASTIGGAIGGAVGAVFGSVGFLGSITSGITASLTAAGLAGSAALIASSLVTFGLSAIGALIFGSLFGGPKKPSARIRGTATEEGFELTSVKRKDGLSKSAANQVGDFVSQVYDSIFLTLDRIGVTFKDEVDVFLRNTEGEFGRITTTFASGAELTAKDLGKSADRAAEELIKQFYQGLTVTRDAEGIITFRSLVVDALTPNREDLQQAIDTFAELDDLSEKTEKRFLEGVKFAQKFSEVVSVLESVAPSLADSIELIGEAAIATAFNLTAQYEELRSQTVKFFGDSSAQLDRVNAAIRKSALASIGLAEASDGTTMSLEDYTSGITASRLAIEKLIRDTEAASMVLETAGFTAAEAAALITRSMNMQVTAEVERFATNVADALAVLKDPSKAAMFDLQEVVDRSNILVAEANGYIDALLENESERLNSVELLTKAQTAAAQAEELRTLNIQNFLETLTIAELKAIQAYEDRFDASVLEAAAAELQKKQTEENFKATQRFITALNDFNNRINSITGSLTEVRFTTSLKSLEEVMTLLGETETTDFARGLTSAVNQIQATNLSVSSVSSALSDLKLASDSGDISLSQYVDSLILISDTALSAIEQQKEAVDKFEDALDELQSAFNSSLNEIQRAISNLRSELVNLVESIDSASNTILDIYDSTLTDIAESGNELFDLRDSAREAFKASADAVKQFEEANNLSGKSAAQINAEISNIQNSIDALLSGGAINLSAFRQLSELSARQNALKRELSGVIAVEDEYASLINDRERAANDLAFAEATVLELGDSLIDTRISESDVIRSVQQATTDFIRAQEDLEEITQLLAENNFDLNQIRKDENQRVREVSDALRTLDADMENLRDLVSSILSDTELKDAISTAAADLGELIAGNLELDPESVEWADTVAEQVEKANNAFNQGLLPLANTINEVFDFNLNNITGVNDTLEVLSVTSSSLTERFNQFNQDLIKYLDTEGLSQFYGTNGVFSEFRNSLLSTLVVNGFDILTVSGGPLDGFQSSVINIQGALIQLANSGATTITSVEGASEALTSLVRVVGSDATGLTTAINSLLAVGTLAPDVINSLSGSIDDFYINLDNLSNLNITFNAGEDFDNIINSVTAFDTNIGGLDITTNLDGIVNSVTNQINSYNSNLGDLSVTVDAAQFASKIATDIMAYNSTFNDLNITANVDELADSAASGITGYNTILGNVSVDVDPEVLAQGIVTAITAYNSQFKDVTVDTNAASLAGSIVTDIQGYNSTFENISVTANANALGGQIATDILGYNSSFSDISVNVDAAALADGIITAVTGYNSQFADVTVNASATTLAGSIVTDIQGYNSAFNDITVAANAESLGVGVVTDIEGYNSTFSNISVNVNAEELAKGIITAVNGYNSEFANVTVNASATSLAGDIVTDILSYNSSFDNLVVDANGTEIGGSIRTDVLSYNSALNDITVLADAATIGGDIATDIKAYSSAINEVLLSFNAATVGGSIRTDVLNYEGAIDSIVLEAKATQVGSSIATDITNYLGSIGSVTITVANSAAGVIKTDINNYVGTIGTIAITAANNLAGRIVTDIENYRATLDNLLVSINSNEVTGDITTDITNYEGTINAISVTAASNLAGRIQTDIANYKGTIDSLSVINSANQVSESIVTDITNYEGSINSIEITNTLNSVGADLKTSITSFYGNIGSITINNSLNTIRGDLITQIESFYSTIDSIIIQNKLNSVTGSIVNQINAFYSSINSIVIDNELNNIRGNLVNQINLYYSSVASITINNKLNTIRGDLITQINAFYSDIGKIIVNNSLNTISGNLVTQITSFYSDIGEITVTNYLNTVAGQIKTQINTFNGTINTIPQISTISNDRADNITDRITYWNDQFTTAISTLSSQKANDINNRINSWNNIITSLANISTLSNSRADDIKARIDYWNSKVTGLAISTNTNTLAGDLQSQINQIFDNLLSAFSLDDVTALEGLTTALKNFSAIAQDLRDLDTAISDFTNGQGLDSLKTVWDGIIEQLKTAWETVNSDVASIPENITITGADADSKNLKSIAENSAKYAEITGESGGAPVYTTTQFTGAAGSFATGGYVDGPGTSTSDSIPVRLSKGEYVIKASSVAKLGTDVLDSINSGADFDTILKGQGRFGDNLVAHINPQEAKALLNMGGSGSRNPKTGLLEFFGGGGGSSTNAYGGLFPQSEGSLLHKSFANDLTNTAQARLNWSGTSTEENIRSELQGDIPYIDKKLFMAIDEANGVLLDSGYYMLPPEPVWKTQNALDQAAQQIVATQLSANRGLEVRGLDTIGQMTNVWALGQYKPNNRLWIDGYAQQSLGVNGEAINFRPNQNLIDIAKYKAGTDMDHTRDIKYSESSMVDYVKALNKAKGVFFDFYMLGNNPINGVTAKIREPYLDAISLSKAAYDLFTWNIPMPSGTRDLSVGSMSTGGLVRGQRDSVPAMLEPGEFVLRKAAVNRMGLDAAVQLNSTGSVDGEANVEVNVINNGTAQQPVNEPTVRRENGKIIVDVILEDMRNNGPIKRTIRSIR